MAASGIGDASVGFEAGVRLPLSFGSATASRNGGAGGLGTKASGPVRIVSSVLSAARMDNGEGAAALGVSGGVGRFSGGAGVGLEEGVDTATPTLVEASGVSFRVDDAGVFDHTDV